MQIDGSVVTEQGVTFAIVIVKPHVLQAQTLRDETRADIGRIKDFVSLPIVLASQDSRGVFTYEGRPDIVDFLAAIDASRIPWARYTVY